jgi:hypothetical protein
MILRASRRAGLQNARASAARAWVSSRTPVAGRSRRQSPRLDRLPPAGLPGPGAPDVAGDLAMAHALGIEITSAPET